MTVMAFVLKSYMQTLKALSVLENTNIASEQNGARFQTSFGPLLWIRAAVRHPHDTLALSIPILILVIVIICYGEGGG